MKIDNDYRLSHVEKGKGDVYHNSFSQYPYRRYTLSWETMTLGRLIRKHKGEKSYNTIDFACGTGRILRILKTLGLNITGVDISSEMLRISRKDHPEVRFFEGDITNTKLIPAGEKFEIVTSFRFFLNAQNKLRVDVLKELRALINKEGIFVFNNHGNALASSIILGRIIVFFKNFLRSENEKYIVNALGEGHMKKLLKDAGFKVIDTKHRGILPIPNEKTKYYWPFYERIENLFGKFSVLRHFSRNVIYVCAPV